VNGFDDKAEWGFDFFGGGCGKKIRFPWIVRKNFKGGVESRLPKSGLFLFTKPTPLLPRGAHAYFRTK
jgi:hypothetical protein